MENKQLPVHEPLIKGFLFFAYPLSIIGADEKTHPWILSNFIQTCFDKDFAKSPVPFTFYSYDFTMSPWLKYEKMQRKTVDHLSKDIMNFIKSCIDNNKYVHLYLDEYHVPNRVNFNKLNFTHENLIYGYDDMKRTFTILGFNENMIFKSTIISYDQFLKAYLGVTSLIESKILNQELHPNSIDIFNTINTFEFNNDGNYSFNKKLVLESLKDYKEGNNTSERFEMIREPWDRAYGMDCYKHFINYFEMLLNNEAFYDIRFLHNLWEHKLLMSKRVDFMQKNNYINLEPDTIKKFETIEKKVLSLRNTMIKYFMTNNRSEIELILSTLPKIAELDGHLTNILIESLSEFSS
ncbi:hypothetical protein COM13_29300 [Bacillus pseudomycoides]|uniref:hypothetical protein n=1 Tax=Bacillus TaxID=1386 RepID=UPI00035C3C10|nr:MULTISPECIES: hypothetical protein [Bacillus]PDX98192.1 hypothetical protein COO07_23295 [Bacillus pseudomycoides]PEK77992.1 hypothetical protein CN597_17750 [Bacillus pseudomycoides]PEN03360.1 hypothetical protein CN640_26565 [Bacillus pseudomycoides]PGB76226.1 hypothetical protein COM13_29300 [Bacillus pseudomycoides]PGS05127.1 hypothetical protein COC54_11435 [Bacillus pseudomycoides]